MTVRMRTYYPSNPTEAATEMRQLAATKRLCPMCGRTAKWYYNCYEQTSRRDTPFRCALHEMSPIPGPSSWTDEEKVSQMY